ncbi:unnamed protein product [Larinioides sclopetarius]|uniref:Helicase senataxin n=1 Tax=Larinioides sclopetarius TaxID=280406 RepID=A0AAV2BK04_9ARAC
MEYFLRQIEAGNPDPLIIKLQSDDLVVGSDTNPVLAKYPRVLPQHAQFLRQFGKWYVKSMRSSEKIYVNGSPLVTHRLKEIQIGDHIAFGSADNQKRFVCCLSAKPNFKLSTIEVIDLSTDDSPASAHNDQAVKCESSGNSNSVITSEHLEGSGKENELIVKRPFTGEKVSDFICPSTVKSEHLPLKRNEPMNRNPATAESELEYISPQTVKSAEVGENEPPCSVNSDSMHKSLPAVGKDLDYSPPPTVKNDYVPFIKDEPSPNSVNSVSMHTSVPAVERGLDYSPPPTVKNDYVPFIKHEPTSSSVNSVPTVERGLCYSPPPTVKNDFMPFIKDEPSQSSVNSGLMQKSGPAMERVPDYSPPPTVKNDFVPFINDEPSPSSVNSVLMQKSGPAMERVPDYSPPPTVKSDFVPFIKDEPLDNSLPTIKNESLNNRHFKVKSEPMDTNPPVIKSEPKDTTYSSSSIKPVNAVPSTSNELVYNTFPVVKNESVDSIYDNSSLHSYNFVPSSSQSIAVSVNHIAASSVEEPKNTSQQLQSTSSSSSAINNQDFFEKLAPPMSVTANESLVTTKNFIPSSKDFASTSSSQNLHANAVSVENYSKNSGYSEVEDVITVSDDEAFLDYGSCKTIKQEYLDDDYNLNYPGIIAFNVSEVQDENANEDNSSINESIKEHEESAKKMLDNDSSSKTSHEYSSFSGIVSQELHVSEESSNSSVSSHEDIIIPFAKKRKMDSSSTDNKNSENNIEMTSTFSKKENEGTKSKKKPYRTFKKQSSKKTLPTEPKPLSHSTKKFCKLKEHKKGSEGIKKKSSKKSKSNLNLSGKKALEKTKTGSALSSQKSLKSSFEEKCVVSKNSIKSSSRNPQPLQQSTEKNMQTSSKISNGIVVTGKLEFKIPKVSKSSSLDKNIASSASKEINLETAHQTKGSTLDKKIPTITRKPENWASRSQFLVTDLTDKPNPVRKTSVVSKTNTKANKLTNSSKISSSAVRDNNKTGFEVNSVNVLGKKPLSLRDTLMNSPANREINETGKESSPQLNSPNITAGLQNSKISSSADRKINGSELDSSNNITGLRNSKKSSSADKKVNKTGKESFPRLDSPNVITGLKNSKMSSSADKEINKTRKGTSSEQNSNSLIVNTNIESSPIPVITSRPNPENSLIPVIVSSIRRNDRKSLTEDRNILKTATKKNIQQKISHNQALPGHWNQQFHGDLELNFESDVKDLFDKNETPVIPGNFQLSKEQNISKHHFPINVASTSTQSSGNTQWQQFHEDQELHFQGDPVHTFDNSKTETISESSFQLSTDQSVATKQQVPFSIASTTNNATNDQQRHNTSVSTANHHNKATKLHIKLSDRKTFMIKRIIEWSEVWFKEYETMSKPHPSLRNGVLHLPLYFNSLENYINSFIRLLLLEIWERVSIEYKPIWKDEKRVTNKFYFIVTSIENKWDVTEYKCEAMINHLSFQPKAGSLVILFIQDENTGSKNLVIGYINSYEVLSNINNINPEFLNVCYSWTKDAYLCRFSVRGKIRKTLYPVFNKIMKGNGLFCLSSYLNLVEACHNLEYSPFCQSILKPDSTTFFSDYPDATSTGNFNKVQMSIIQGISSEIEKEVSEPKFFLIQGAPGTGKTRIILGLLENLIFSRHSKQKILIVAPSCVAIDEIGSRLIEFNECSRSWRSHERIRFVNVNLSGKTSEKMRPFCLDEMYREYKIKSKIERFEKMNVQIQILLKSNDPLDQEELKSLIEQQKKLKNQIEFNLSDEKSRLDYYQYMLLESQVILTTVNCCSSSLLQEFCKSYSNPKFSCCIVDEVTQCTELEFLQVISLGINKLILLGDHYGLPAVVLSKTAENFGYGRSVFERFLQYFSHSQQKSPVMELFQQYRMHSHICSFPSYYFYNNRLTTADGIDLRYEYFLAINNEKMLAPYTVFCIQKYGNPKLAVDSVIKLCIQSVTHKPNVSVGIIVPSREMQDVFALWVTTLRKSNSKYETIEVGTVENFQGQEKEFVFLCCYYDGETNSFLTNKRKLNVALTRARKCLVLCIFSTSWKLEQEWLQLVFDAQKRDCFYFITDTKEMSLILR